MGAEDKSYYRNQREEPGLSRGRQETDLQKKWKFMEMKWTPADRIIASLTGTSAV